MYYKFSFALLIVKLSGVSLAMPSSYPEETKGGRIFLMSNTSSCELEELESGRPTTAKAKGVRLVDVGSDDEGRGIPLDPG